jgi:hypothetical protein
MCGFEAGVMVHLSYSSLLWYLNCNLGQGLAPEWLWPAVYTSAKTIPMEANTCPTLPGICDSCLLALGVERCQVWSVMVFWGWSWADALVTTVFAQGHTSETCRARIQTESSAFKELMLSLLAAQISSPEITVTQSSKLAQLLNWLGFSLLGPCEIPKFDSS